MYPKTIIGNYVTLYGVFIAIGIIACIFLLRFLGKKRGIDKKFLDFVEMNGYISIAVGFFASWIFQAVYDWIETGVFSLANSGITFIGGLIGGVATFLVIYFIFMKTGRLTGSIVEILPIAPPIITIAHAFGRVGCLFAGCCGGLHLEEGDPFYFLAMKFPIYSYETVDSLFGGTMSVPKEIVGYEYCLPTQLFEALFLFLITGVMVLLLLKKNFKYNFVVYLFGYGIWRFLIEFIRGDERGEIIKGLSFPTPSQFFSMIMILIAVPVFFLLKYLFKKQKENLKIMQDPTDNEDEANTLAK